MSEDKKQKLQDSGLVEWSVFSELIAMDEDEEGFSKGLFQTFTEQFVDTFKEIDKAVESSNLSSLSSLGHYLKGSAAALGLTKISSQCERIQNYGHKNNFDNFKLEDANKEKDDTDETDKRDSLTEDDDSFWIALIEDALDKARDGFKKSKAALNEYFDDEL